MGREHALLLAARGASVVVNDLGVDGIGSGQSAGPADEVVSDIKAQGGAAVSDNNDVSTPEGGAAVRPTLTSPRAS
jgi:NAD(P)-dependent dehydrogenase (short-subunit alcohol dehydrogenase family)